jgi:hypothetical protein
MLSAESKTIAVAAPLTVAVVVSAHICDGIREHAVGIVAPAAEVGTKNVIKPRQAKICEKIMVGIRNERSLLLRNFKISKPRIPCE